ncbi:MAG TPA: hypothetical protein VGF08_10005, partial [Terriglobales bacterium]
MKFPKRSLLVVGAVAGFLLGITKIGENPIARGYDTEFAWEFDPQQNLVLSSGATDMSCWLRLRFSNKTDTLSPITFSTSRIRVVSEDDPQWVDVVADTQLPQDKFKWPSGTKIVISSPGKLFPALTVTDWYVYISDKDNDSQSRAWYRKLWFRICLFCLIPLALLGIVLEAVRKGENSGTLQPLTAEDCVKALITQMAGKTVAETQQMRQFLTRV